MESLESQKALQYAEHYGIVNYSIKNNSMIYYVNYHLERMTYKCIVNLKSMAETRIQLKSYNN